MPRFVIVASTTVVLIGILLAGADHPPPPGFYLLAVGVLVWCILVGAFLGRGWWPILVGALSAATVVAVRCAIGGYSFALVAVVAAVAGVVAALMEGVSRRLPRKQRTTIDHS